MDFSEQKQHIEAAYKLLHEDSTTLEKCQSLITLLGGVNPKLDAKLESFKKALSKLSYLQKGEIIELAAEAIPEQTEEEKRRKKALLLFVKSAKQLESEIERVKAELETGHQGQNELSSFGRIVTFAKGPFGIITLLALIIAASSIYFGNQKVPAPVKKTPQSPALTPITGSSPTPIPTATPVSQSKIQVITFNNHKIPLSELIVRTGPDCTNSPGEASHYHAKNGQSARALDGIQVSDPGSCAFGKVGETRVEEIELP